MKRITPRTCLWPLAGCVSAAFALSIGLTFRSNHHCYAGVCGEWLFPLQARLHVVVWYSFLGISIALLSVRTFQPFIREVVSTPMGTIRFFGKQLRVSGVLLVLWICVLYGILISLWWSRLDGYFKERGDGLPGNGLLAAIALTGHLADVTMGMVLLPVSRHSALASFFKLAPTTIFVFHITMAYILFTLVLIHASIYASWVALYDSNKARFQVVFPVLNPTYLYHEVWPGNSSSLGIWRASLIFTGIASSLIMIAMLFTSFPAIRRKHFNLFYFTHLLGIVAVVIICLHASTMLYCTLPGLGMWLIDWGMRVVELKEKLDSRLIALGNGWYTLALPLPRKRLSGCACHSPLAHFAIHHSHSSIREVHPFTTITHLASKKPLMKDGRDSKINVQFLFKASDASATSLKSKQWTNRLGSLVDDEERRLSQISAPIDSHEWLDKAVDGGVDTTIRLEGPYFTPANPERYKNVVCLVAGTGLSGAIAIAAAFHAQRTSIVTVTSRPSSLSAAAPPTPSLEEAPACTVSAVNNGRWQRCTVIWTVRETDFVEMPFFNELACEGLDFRVHKTGGSRPRLDTKAALTEICGNNARDTWCYISGPNGFITAAERACGEIGGGLTWFAARWE